MTAGRWVAAFAAVVDVGHHTGFLLEPLGEVGATRWADWVDLALPYAVIGAAAGALATVDARPRAWLVLGAAAIVYTQGHGIHLAANSIANVDPSRAAHLWDEVVGHYLWYGGLVGIVAALAVALGHLPRPRSRLQHLLVLVFGLTVFTNSVEGGTPWLGLLASVVFLAWALPRRDRAPGLLVLPYAVAAIALLAWGVYWRGFPQFTELGWV
jgi:hypothetical protein